MDNVHPGKNSFIKCYEFTSTKGFFSQKHNNIQFYTIQLSRLNNDDKSHFWKFKEINIKVAEVVY